MDVKYYYCDGTLLTNKPSKQEYFTIELSDDGCKILLVRNNSTVYKVKYNRHIDMDSNYFNIMISFDGDDLGISNKYCIKAITNLYGILQEFKDNDFIILKPSNNFIKLMNVMIKYLDNVSEQYTNFIKVMNRSLFSSTKSSTN